VEVTFAPALGMLACSLRRDGRELLGQRKGLEGYERSGSTMGVPLLHPWANRLGGFAYSFAGRDVELDPDSPDVKLEEHGLPIHGLLGALRHWKVVADGDQRLVGGARLDGLEGFPFPHRIEVEAALEERTLRITTTLTATGDGPLPVCFGYHPYLAPPGPQRAEWDIDAPVREHLVLDESKVPTGEREPAEPIRGALGERTFDDAYTVDPAGATFRAQDVVVAFEQGYPYAQIFAPPDDDVICFEPMTAPADALRHDPPAVAPGESYVARFSISV